MVKAIKEVIADEPALRLVGDRFLSKPNSRVRGLLIGHRCEHQGRDFVITLVETPATPADLLEDNIPADASKSETKKAKSECDDLWFSEHARQVRRALPGGLDVLGIFHFTSSDEYKKTLMSHVSLMGEASSVESTAVILHLCDKTKKYTAKSHAIGSADGKSLALTKKANVADSLVILRANVAVDGWLAADIAKSYSPQSVTDSLSKAVIASLENSIAVDAKTGAVLAKDDQIGKVVKKDAKANSSSCIDISLFSAIPTAPNAGSAGDNQNVIATALAKGTIAVSAYMNPRAPCTAIQSALAKSAASTIATRVEILADELGDDELSGSAAKAVKGNDTRHRRWQNATWTPPVKVAVRSDVVPWSVVEYRMDGESDDEVLERLEMIGLVGSRDKVSIVDIESKGVRGDKSNDSSKSNADRKIGKKGSDSSADKPRDSDPVVGDKKGKDKKDTAPKKIDEEARAEEASQQKVEGGNKEGQSVPMWQMLGVLFLILAVIFKLTQ